MQGRLMILGMLLVVVAIILLLGGKTDAERENPDRLFTPLRDQWPFSLLRGRDWNARSIVALICILLGFALQGVAMSMAEP